MAISTIKAISYLYDARVRPGQLDGAIRVGKFNAHAYILRDDTVVILGTDDTDDVGDIFNMKGVPLGDGWRPKTDAHLGMWSKGIIRHAASIASDLGSRRPQYFIGHSLGGAAAQLLAMHYRKPSLTFGSVKPSIGDRRYSRSLELTFAHDWVRTLPQRDGFKYGTSGQRILFGKEQPANKRYHKIRDYRRLIPVAISKGQVPASW